MSNESRRDIIAALRKEKGELERKRAELLRILGRYKSHPDLDKPLRQDLDVVNLRLGDIARELELHRIAKPVRRFR